VSAPELLGGRYELRGVLGRGGMAEVRDGWDIRLARPVAVKIMHPGFDNCPGSRRRFEAEARAAARLNNSHIVAVHDSGEHNGMPFIVMERLPGESLHDRIVWGPLPQPLVRAVLDDILSALTTAHGSGILHRDIKPANILFTPSGEAKLSDFGVAKSGQVALTATGQIFGTMAYLSPDRVSGRPATAADDIYAVGVVGYEALTGRRPYMEQDLAVLAAAILRQDPPPLAALRPDVDPALAAVVQRAMARDPAARYPSAVAMRAALAGQAPVAVGPAGTRVMESPLLTPMPMAPPSTARPTPRRWRLMLGAAVAMILLAAIVIALGSQETASPQQVTTSTTVPPAPTTPSASPTVPPTATEVPPAPNPRKPHKGPGKH
jgi:serine/threonine protein kinase